jgi:hypothetical protein
MRKIQALAAVALVGFLTACNKGPQPTAEAFITAMADGKSEEMTKLSTPESAPILGFMSMMLASKPEEKTKLKEIKIVSCQETDSTATCKTSGGTKGEGELKLKKVDGEWKVHMAKEGATVNPSVEPATAEATAADTAVQADTTAPSSSAADTAAK